MRNPERITPIIKKIEKLWLENPDFRFGQLIMAITNTNEHNPILFNMEELELLKKLEKFEKIKDTK
ncbi:MULTISPECIES: hypothetical protein [Empedobacter]|uniref:Uncharacterized protein n=1 Tax=Empedobacter falsenii TaxID=343874 RepID=A0A7H9DSS6_9FLAO|nr:MULTISPECIES: hypothetical protein [Empedobacter]MDH2208419.1 hypothetical protein [Empedobacter sp. GD03644]QLL57789.1 hypothetical protein FH779_06720 [Empedobacter falsenii]